jgi:hypothetical protein
VWRYAGLQSLFERRELNRNLDHFLKQPDLQPSARPTESEIVPDLRRLLVQILYQFLTVAKLTILNANQAAPGSFFFVDRVVLCTQPQEIQ